MKIKQTICLVFVALFALSSCGKKAPTEFLPDAKRPKFDRVIDEVN